MEGVADGASELDELEKVDVEEEVRDRVLVHHRDVSACEEVLF